MEIALAVLLLALTILIVLWFVEAKTTRKHEVKNKPLFSMIDETSFFKIKDAVYHRKIPSSNLHK